MFCNLLLILLALIIEVSSERSCSDVECLSKSYTRINSGVSVQRNSRPFQVALILRVGEAGEVGFCGGSLIDPEWILTAAHCCFQGEQEVTHGQVILGAHSLYDRYENGRRIVNVDEIVVHPDWNPNTLANDIALLKLANVVQTTDTIKTIRLPYSTMSITGQGVTASGWGVAANGLRILVFDGRILPVLLHQPSCFTYQTVRSGVTFVSPTLREKVSTVLTNSFCSSLFLNDQLPDNVICTLSTNSGTCKGDNGGPLTIFNSETEENILVGVASFVEVDGCNTDLPSVFTRVQHFLPWIGTVTGNNLD